jgi:hypothetical protein
MAPDAGLIRIASNPQARHGACSGVAPTVGPSYNEAHHPGKEADHGHPVAWRVCSTALHLPSCSPELNLVEKMSACLKSHCLSNRVFADYNGLFAAVRAAWLQLDEPRLRSITHTAWITPAA